MKLNNKKSRSGFIARIVPTETTTRVTDEGFPLNLNERERHPTKLMVCRFVCQKILCLPLSLFSSCLLLQSVLLVLLFFVYRTWWSVYVSCILLFFYFFSHPKSWSPSFFGLHSSMNLKGSPLLELHDSLSRNACSQNSSVQEKGGEDERLLNCNSFCSVLFLPFSPVLLPGRLLEKQEVFYGSVAKSPRSLRNKIPLLISCSSVSPSLFR